LRRSRISNIAPQQSLVPPLPQQRHASTQTSEEDDVEPIVPASSVDGGKHEWSKGGGRSNSCRDSEL
jgi:hypothetical protein